MASSIPDLLATQDFHQKPTKLSKYDRNQRSFNGSLDDHVPPLLPSKVWRWFIFKSGFYISFAMGSLAALCGCVCRYLHQSMCAIQMSHCTSSQVSELLNLQISPPTLMIKKICGKVMMSDAHATRSPEDPEYFCCTTTLAFSGEYLPLAHGKYHSRSPTPGLKFGSSSSGNSSSHFTHSSDLLKSIIAKKRCLTTLSLSEDPSNSLNREPSELGLWHAMVSKVPLLKVLPVGLGGCQNAEVDIAAYFGDKVLSAALARIQRRWHTYKSVGDLSQQAALTLSNKSLASHLPDLLPQYAGLVEWHKQTHNAATTLEAAVAEVIDGEGGPEAVEELAEYLLKRTISREVVDETEEENPSAVCPKMAGNPKGYLLERKGRVTSELLPGYPDHAPRFCAMASLWGYMSSADGATKKAAEQAAATNLLTLLEVYSVDLSQPSKPDELPGTPTSHPKL